MIALGHLPAICHNAWSVSSDLPLKLLCVASIFKKGFVVTGVPPNDQKMVYAGDELEDGKTLSAYNICGEQMHLVSLHLLEGGRIKMRKAMC